MKNIFISKTKWKGMLLATVNIIITATAFGQLANDDCSAAVMLIQGTNCTSPAPGSTVGGTVSPQTPFCAPGLTADVWYSFVATDATAVVTLVTADPTVSNPYNYSYATVVYSGNCGGLTQIACNSGSGGSFNGTGAPFATSLSGLSIGSTYYIRICNGPCYDASFQSVPNDINFQICVSTNGLPPVNDACADAIDISNQMQTGNTNNATESQPPITCSSTTSTTANDIWFQFTAGGSGNQDIEVAALLHTVLEVFSGTCGNLTSISCLDYNSTTESAETMTIPVIEGDIYYIRAYSFDGETVDFPYTLSIQPGNFTLPVTMSQLAGKLTAGNKALLNWNTYREQNNRGFDILSSQDGKVFHSIASVPSLSRGGNSYQTLNYQFTDPDAIGDGTVYYRLRQVDIDGQTKESNIVQLNGFNPSDFKIAVYPNPVGANRQLCVSANALPQAGAVIVLTDVIGRIVKKVPAIQKETVIGLAGLPLGTYFLRYITVDHYLTLKLSVE